MTSVRLWDAPSARADIRAGLLSAKIARKRKGKYFRTGKAEPRVYRRGWRPGAQSLWIRGLYGDRQTLTPMSAGRWMATSSFCSSNTPMPRAAGSPTGRFFFLGFRLTSSQSEKIVMRAIKSKCLDFALAQFYRSMHWSNGAQCG